MTISFTKLLCSAVFTAVIAFPAAVFAQIDNQTSTADPARTGDYLQPRLDLPESGSNVSVEGTDLLTIPEGAQDIRFVLQGIEISGNNIYSDAELSSFYRDNIGQEISLADVYRIANDISTYYREKGFVLTQLIVPPQRINDGMPELQIIEGRIDQVEIRAEGESGFATKMFRSYTDSITNGSAINIKTLERQLLLINDLPGVRARSIVSPSQSAPGAADLIIIVERDPFDALFRVDNYGSRYLGPWVVGGVAALNSALGLNERIRGQVAYAPDSGTELIYGSLDYEQPFGPYGTRFGFGISKTKTDPGFRLAQFDVEGDSELYSARIEHPIIRSRRTNLDGLLSFDWRDVETTNNISDPRNDQLRVLRGGLRYGFQDNLISASLNEVNIALSQGLDIFNASDANDLRLSRPDGDPTFTKLTLSAQRLQKVVNGINLQLGVQGQITNDALLASEEFGIGGFYSGRGYDPSEIVGDKGIAGQAELQWNNFIEPDGKIIRQYQLYGFYDIGKVWNEDATTAEDKQQSLASTGLGLRLNLVQDVRANATLALPLTREVESENDKGPRFYFSLSKAF